MLNHEEPDQEEKVPSSKPRKEGMSRREFAARAAFAPIVSGLAAAYLPAAAPPGEKSVSAALPESVTEASKLSPASQAEAEARVQAILARRGNRLTEPQKQDIRRLTTQLQKTLDAVRKAPLENGDSPALYLKPLVEREKARANSKPAPQPKPAVATKKPSGSDHAH